MIQDRARVTVKCEQEILRKISNSTIFNDLERHLTQTQIARSCHYLTLIISEPTRDTDIATTTHICPTQRCHFKRPWAASSDL